MKAIHLITLVIFLFPNFLFAQEDKFNELLEELTNQIEEVPTKKYTYTQTLVIDDTSSDFIRFEAARIDSKGKSKSLISEFNLKHLSTTSTRRANVKDVIVVKTNIEGKKKYVRTLNGKSEQGKYTNEWEIICNNASQADRIVDILKKLIALAKKRSENKTLPTTFESQIGWLSNNVKAAKKNGKVIEQKLEQESEIAPTRIIFSTKTEGKKSTNELNYGVNLVDLNPKVELVVKGKNIFIPLRSKNKYIRFTKNGVLDNFQKEFKIYAANVENGLNIQEVLENIIKGIPKENNSIAIKSTSITSLVKSVNDGKRDYEQTVRFDETCIATFETSSTNKKGNKETLNQVIHLDDLNDKSVNIKISKKTIWINVKTEKSAKYIQILEENEKPKFSKNFQIRAENIENAKLLVKQLKKEINDCEGKAVCNISEEIKNDLPGYIQKRVADFELGSKSYQQSFAPSEDEPNHWKYTRVEPKGKSTIEKKWVFEPAYIDAAKIDFDLAKGQLVLLLPTNNKEDIIKYFEDSEPDGYSDQIAIYLPDIATARNMVCAFQMLIKEK